MGDQKIEAERVELSTSLTALKPIDSANILIGMGGEVRLVRFTSKNRWESKVRHQVFSNQSVHGLVGSPESSRQILVFGGRKYALIHLSIAESQPLIELCWRCDSEDWILDGHWLDEERLALLTAHGKLVEVSAQTGRSVRTAVCPDRSILYSARIVGGPEWNDIVLLGGTVHNQINVWSPCGTDSLGTTIVTLSGHKGVIFSVRFDKDTNRICSTSDDRTARIWQVAFGEETFTNEAERWCKAEFSLVLTLFGHKARVWDSLFLTHSLLATIAEDGGVMVWSEKGECLMQSWVQAGLLCLDLVPSGMSSSLGVEHCSHDATEEQVTSLILTAGATDGSLYLFPVTLPRPSLNSLPLTENVPRQVCLSSGNVITYTEQGCILMNTTGDDWTQCYSSEKISSYCILSMSPCRNYLAAADIFGSLYLFSVSGRRLELLICEEVIKGRVFSIHWLDQHCLLVCGPQGILKLLKAPTNSNESEFSSIGSFELPDSKERWTTCSVMIRDNFLICGDRMGSLHLFSLLSQQEKPVLSLTKVHGSRGVSCIQSICQSDNKEEQRLVSCGRDGTLRQYRLNLGDTPSMEPLLCLRLSMDWASHIITSPSFGQLIIGFHNVYFCVWSLREQRFLLKLKCWGGHRSWDLHLDSEETLEVVFIKDKSVHSLVSPLGRLALPAPLIGLHSKTVNACCWDEDNGLIVSGSEDTSMRVSYQRGNELHPVCCVESHVSSARAVARLKLLHSTSPSTLVVSAGGRAQLKLWTLSPSGELCERGSHMLRREEDLRRDGRDEKGLDEPEVRYMDISLQQTCPQSTFIYTVASDGIFRVFKVNLVNFSLEMVICDNCEEGRCFLKVITSRTNKASILAITGSTDGHITFWTHSLISGEMKRVEKLKRHSGGVNSLSMRFLSDVADDSSILVASGGDDSAVVLSLFNMSSDLSFKQTAISKLDTLQTCQVTGLELVERYVVSGGLDGRLCLVQWQLDSGSLECKHLMTLASSLSDIHGLVIHLKQKELLVCVFGIGLEVIRISLPPD